MDDIRLLILLLPLIFLIHEIEEIFAVEEWSRRYRGRLKRLSQGIVGLDLFARKMIMSSLQFTIAAAFEFSLFLLAAIWAVTSLQPGAGFFVFTALMAGLVLHVIVHAVQAVILRAYIPGLVSGLLIVAPFCLYLYDRLLDIGLLNWVSILWTSVVGGGLILPLILLAQFVGRKLLVVFSIYQNQGKAGGESNTPG